MSLSNIINVFAISDSLNISVISWRVSTREPIWYTQPKLPYHNISFCVYFFRILRLVKKPIWGVQKWSRRVNTRKKYKWANNSPFTSPLKINSQIWSGLRVWQQYNVTVNRLGTAQDNLSFVLQRFIRCLNFIQDIVVNTGWPLFLLDIGF